MDIQGSRILILGGSGLVGMAIARELLRREREEHDLHERTEGPLRTTLVVSALTRQEAEDAAYALEGEAPERVQVVAEWGNVFAPSALKDLRMDQAIDDPAARGAILDALFGAVEGGAGPRSWMAEMILRHRPHLVVDCVNTATGFAYQNVFKSAASLRRAAGRDGKVDLEAVEKHLLTLPLPSLIQHVSEALATMREVKTRSYLKVGTAGTGGMGLNIPFTHSEESPSRQLLTKSAVAGAHTLLLYLAARTPDAPAVKEIKPTAAISWKRIGSGVVTRRGAPIPRVDAVAPVALDQAFAASGGDGTVWRETGEPLTGVFLDAGENGLFSPDEFEAITALGLMEFITPEEIARDAVREITGRPTGRDVVAALDASTSGPTYRAGVLRQGALSYMEELEERDGSRSVGFEMLGPPRLTKLLFEGEILRRLCEDLPRAEVLDADEMSREALELVEEDADLRTRILSAGLAILLPDGGRLLRGRKVEVEPAPGEAPADTARKGWVDLRAANWELWRGRAAGVVARLAVEPGPEGGSRWDAEAWHREGAIRPGALAAWILRHEDGGERIKR